MYTVFLPIAVFLLFYTRRKDVYDLHHSILGNFICTVFYVLPVPFFFYVCFDVSRILMKIFVWTKSRPLIFCADYCGHHGCNKKCSWPASTRLLLALLSWWEWSMPLFPTLSLTRWCIFFIYIFFNISTFILSLIRALHPVNFLFLSDALTTVLLFDHFNNLYLTFIFLEVTMFPASCYILILTFEYN